MRINMISLLMGIIYDLAKEDNPDIEMLHLNVDSDGYKSITGYKAFGPGPDGINIEFSAFTLDGSEWKVEAKHGTDT